VTAIGAHGSEIQGFALGAIALCVAPAAAGDKFGQVVAVIRKG
jgi:hypothetical protein